MNDDSLSPGAAVGGMLIAKCCNLNPAAFQHKQSWPYSYHKPVVESMANSESVPMVTVCVGTPFVLTTPNPATIVCAETNDGTVKSSAKIMILKKAFFMFLLNLFFCPIREPQCVCIT